VRSRGLPVAVGCALVSLALAACGGSSAAVAKGPAGWAEPNQNGANTRAAPSTITSANVHELRPAWHFRFPGVPGFSGYFASTPLVVGNRVLIEDLNSDVYAFARTTGRILWVRRYHQMNGGPNGLAVAGGRVFGETATKAFALSLASGRQLWLRRLTIADDPLEVAPLVEGGVVYTSTVAQAPGGRGTMYALDAATGATEWRFDTIRDPWPVPSQDYGGGLWDTPALGPDGTLYAGTANPYPIGGTPQHPNGSGYAGSTLYTDSLVALDGADGALRWFDQVTPNDTRDFDFQDSPILASPPHAGSLVIGAGKSGRVVAWDTKTHARVWDRLLGRQLHAAGPLPTRRATAVCPGLVGGVETPMAYANGDVFVPVVDLCMKERATGPGLVLIQTDYSKGKGELVALSGSTGAIRWRHDLPSPNFGCATVANDVVFTATYDGRIYAFQTATGKLLWTAQAPAGINSCPAVSGDTLVVGAGVLLEDNPAADPQVVVYRLPG